MTLTCDNSTFSDIKYVVERTWARGAEEAERCGFRDPHAWAEHFHGMSKEYGFVLQDHKTPIAVFGATRIGNTYFTYFAATSDFERVGKDATVFLVEFLKEKTAERPGERLELGTACTHPKAHKWFQKLGFEHIESKGVYSRYVYKPKEMLT